MKRSAIAAHAARVLTRTEAAEYVGLSVTQFDERVAAGIYPLRLPDEAGLARWDRQALDRAVAVLAGVTDATVDTEDDALKLLE